MLCFFNVMLSLFFLLVYPVLGRLDHGFVHVLEEPEQEAEVDSCSESSRAAATKYANEGPEADNKAKEDSSEEFAHSSHSLLAFLASLYKLQSILPRPCT